MACNTDFIKFHDPYLPEGIPNGISIVHFSQMNGIVYKHYVRWYKTTIVLRSFLLRSFLAMVSQSLFEGHYTGSNPDSAVICPELRKMAGAYGISYIDVYEEGQALVNTIADVLSYSGCMICEIHMRPEQTFFPKSASFMGEDGRMTTAPLEKMAPFMLDDLRAKCVYSSIK